MTTSGCAKYAKLLEELKSPILVIEEAAEVLESSVLTCITSSLRHIIMIGDHMQLRPSV
jgi:superfamily I DNA and/or RNA helicase